MRTYPGGREDLPWRTGEPTLETTTLVECGIDSSCRCCNFAGKNRCPLFGPRHPAEKRPCGKTYPVVEFGALRAREATAWPLNPQEGESLGAGSRLLIYPPTPLGSETRLRGLPCRKSVSEKRFVWGTTHELKPGYPTWENLPWRTYLGRTYPVRTYPGGLTREDSRPTPG